MPAVTGNIFASMPRHAPEEQTRVLLTADTVRVERIVSHGHATPEGDWYDQDWAEWVILLQGSAALLFEGESAPRTLRPGDYLHIPAHARHRVLATDPAEPTVWLAVHHR